MVGESGDWNDAARKQPIDGRSVLALLPMDNAGFTPDAGQSFIVKDANGQASACVYCENDAVRHFRRSPNESEG